MRSTVSLPHGRVIAAFPEKPFASPRSLVIAGLILIGLATPPLWAEEVTGRAIAIHLRDDHRADAETAKFEMTIVNKKGRKKVRVLESLGQSPKGGPDKTILRFLEPADISGTAVLTIEHKGEEDEQWMYLPALKRTRRIAGSSKQESFMGSDLSYEDLRPRDVDAYSYRLLQEKQVGADACYLLEASPKKGSKVEDSAYQRSVTTVRKKDFVPLTMEGYDSSGKLIKTILYKNYTDVEGHLRPDVIEVRNEKKGSRTIIRFTARKLNQPFPEGAFTTDALEEGSEEE